MKNENKGITLLALVITIIILIILAGISLSLTIGENGIIGKAKQAKENTIQASKEEEEELNKLWAEIENEGGISGSTGDNKDKIIDDLTKEKEELEKTVADLNQRIEDLVNENNTKNESFKSVIASSGYLASKSRPSYTFTQDYKKVLLVNCSYHHDAITSTVEKQQFFLQEQQGALFKGGLVGNGYTTVALLEDCKVGDNVVLMTGEGAGALIEIQGDLIGNVKSVIASSYYRNSSDCLSYTFAQEYKKVLLVNCCYSSAFVSSTVSKQSYFITKQEGSLFTGSGSGKIYTTVVLLENCKPGEQVVLSAGEGTVALLEME